MRPPFPGAYWFAAAVVLGVIRIIANASHLDGVFLVVFILAAIGFYRFVTRIPTNPPTQKDEHHDA